MASFVSVSSSLWAASSGSVSLRAAVDAINYFDLHTCSFFFSVLPISGILMPICVFC